jgi:clan AA aspartic protease
MITGSVTARRAAIVLLTLRGPGGREENVEAVVDTGFDGELALPPAVIARLGFSWHRRGRALLADGSSSIFDIYDGGVLWDGQPRRVVIDEVDAVPLVGMAMLDGYELVVQVRAHGRVTISHLPAP